MKRLCYLLVLMCITASSLSAQRRVDLALHLIYPTPLDSIPTGLGFNLKVSVKNVGTTNFEAPDSMLIFLRYDNDTLPIIGPVLTTGYLVVTGQQFKPNDSVVVDYPSSFGYPLGNRIVRVCGIVMPKAGPGRTAMIDENEEDNKDCADVYVKRDPSNVPVVSREAIDAVIFPNPAHGAAQLGFRLTKPSVASALIKDITGRTVATVAEEKYPAGQQQMALPIAHLPAGVYSFHLQVNGLSTAGKFTIH